MLSIQMNLLRRTTIQRTVGVLGNLRQQQQCYSSKAVITTPAMETTPSISDAPDAERVSGAPMELAMTRSVRIFLPAKNAMQSGVNNTRYWKMDFDVLPEGERWENPLMGWASSANAVQALEMQFDTKEDAIYFAEKQGWTYYIQEPKVRKFNPQIYADNFRYKPDKLRIIHTK